MITVERVVYEYPGKRALKDVSFSIPERSITALVGPNGAGKTTLLRCMAALDEPFSGRITVGGIDVGLEPRRAHQLIGYLSDFFGLYDDLTVRQSLQFAGYLHKLPNSDIHRQISEIVDLMGLEPWLAFKTQTLSRGWRQRLGIAQALIHKPRYLLLDEPASGLDPEARIELSALFRHLRDQGMTLVISSHILAELEDYCTDMLILRDGTITAHQAGVVSDDEVAVFVSFTRDTDRYISLLQKWPDVAGVIHKNDEVRFTFKGNDAKQQLLLAELVKAGAMVKSFRIGRESLQDVYLSSGMSKESPDAR